MIGRPATPFWDRVDTSGSCWVWTGACNRKGYGEYHFNGKARRAHRVSWELTYGPIPEGLIVCHRCDNPSCVRPDHLFLGTHSDNAIDRERKGRGGSARGDNHWTRRSPERIVRGLSQSTYGLPRSDGEHNPSAVLTWEKVRAIRAAYGQPGQSIAVLARRYGVGTSTIHRIVTHAYWKEEGQ